MPEIPKKSGEENYEHIELTQHYKIRTASSEKTAKETGALLESIYRTLSQLFGPPEKQHRRLKVHTFAEIKEFKTHISKHNLQLMSTTGFFTPADPAGIYLPLAEINGEHPFFTLTHEATHQYLHEIKGISIPATSAKLPAVPLWLNEGLALNMEAALVNKATFQAGRVHSPRLQHLQQLIKSGQAPTVKNVLSKSYGEPFTNADYSVAWGVTYFLLTETSPGYQWGGFWAVLQESLRREASQLTKNRKFLKPEVLISLQTRWADHLQATATEIFRNQVVGQDNDWSRWQKHWEMAILQLTPTPE